ncbi:MAG: gamma-glutamyltransferase [Nostocoides sp.]
MTGDQAAGHALTGVLRPPGTIGRKAVAQSSVAMVSTQDPRVTEAALGVLRDGGGAIDALIAACVTQTAVAPCLTNLAGTVTVLYHDTTSGLTRQLNSPGWHVPDVTPCRPIPVETGTYASQPPGASAVIPGFMPAMRAVYDTHGTLPWPRLIEPAANLARDGHEVTSFEHYLLATSIDYYRHSAAGREFFAPGGRIPQVGERWAQPELAETLRHLACEGPEYMLSGRWATDFVAMAHDLGWPISVDDLSGYTPQWQEPLRFTHREHEVVSLAAPQLQGVSLGFVLGVLDQLGIHERGHYTQDALSCYLLAHVLRRARIDLGHLNDPAIFADPSSVLLDPDYHAQVARLIECSMPRVDLSRHFALTAPKAATLAGPAGVDSCEISIVDAAGNWVQAMTTLSGSGIPGMVLHGVPMNGSLTTTSMNAWSNISGWLTGGGQVRTCLGNTLVFKDGQPWLGLGTPGKVEATVPQVLSSILDFGLDPDEADARALIMPLQDDYSLAMETAVDEAVLAGLARLGVRVVPLGTFNWHMGSFEMTWRTSDGQLSGSSGCRREGMSAGL